MTPYDFVHLALLAVGGEIKGKTKLQKTMYFLGLLTGQVGELGYRAHYYGPYSDEVADAVSTLEGLGFVSSDVASVGALDPQGFEVRRTDFRLTQEGQAIARSKAGKHAGLFEQLRQAAGALKQAGEQDYVKLSIAAKTFFMLREKNAPATEGELEQLAKRFGWNVSPQQIGEAAEYLRKLGLAEPARNGR
jgi:uncharacterized protein YwgA